jgi:hypothetical protein
MDRAAGIRHCNNDEARMSKHEGMTKPRQALEIRSIRALKLFRHPSFGFRHSFLY